SLVERLHARELKASVAFMVHAFIRHWKEHIRGTLQPLLEGYHIGLETGDLNFATFDAFGFGFQSYWVGTELTGLEREMAKYSDAMSQLKQNHSLNINELHRQVTLSLLGRSVDPCRLVGEAYNEESMLPICFETNDRSTICYIHLHKLILCYLFQEYPQATEHAAVAEKNLDSLVGTAAIHAFYLYDSLARLSILPDVCATE